MGSQLVPPQWGLTSVQSVTRFAYGDSLAGEAREDGDIPVYGSNGAVGEHAYANTNAPCIIVGRKGSYGKVTYSGRECFAIDTTYFIDDSQTVHCLRWLFYVLSSCRLDTLSEDIGVPGLSREDAYSRFVPVCTPAEQCAIATFLDRETAKIDALIAKKERLIELLQEKRTALISHAVSKGLDPAAPLKDSGVEWLGEIPAHWEVKRLKFAAKLESGHTPSRSVPEYWENCTIPWVSLNDVGYLQDHDHISETANYINEEGLAGSSARMLPEETVILSRDATVGRCGILKRPMATSQHFVNWICRPELLPRYLLLVFRSPMQQEFARLTMGATLRTIGMPDVNSFCVPIPPVREQEEINAYVEQERHRLNALLAKVTEHIERLRELRTALISAAVTGRIDVREEVGADKDT